MRINRLLIIALLISQITYASGTAKLVDFIVSSSGVSELVAKTGLSGKDAVLVESYVQSALRSIGNKGALSKAELLEAISKMPVTGPDAAFRKELQLLLSQPEDKIKKEDIVNAINHIIYFANRHGKSVVITCSECVNENIAKSGFRFAVANIKNSSAKRILNEMIPNNPKDLHHFISAKSKRLGFGDYSRVTPDVVKPEEEKSLALFLSLSESGTEDFKKLSSAIKKLSTQDGRTDLFNPSHPNKFWKIAANDFSSKETKLWADLLDETADVSETEKISTEEAFYKVLKRKTEGNSSLSKKFQSIKSKRCFFK